MGFFDRYFEPQEFEVGRGLLGRLQSLQGDQSAYQAGGQFGGWPDARLAGNPSSGPATSQRPIEQLSAAPAETGPQYPDGVSSLMRIGNYFMPQFGASQAVQSAQPQPDVGDRLSAGFRSWAYTPVGNPFAALANAITGFTSGQFASTPPLSSQDVKLRPAGFYSGAEGGDTPITRAPPTLKPFVPRTFSYRR
jgi:hypothetical protein